MYTFLNFKLVKNLNLPEHFRQIKTPRFFEAQVGFGASQSAHLSFPSISKISSGKSK